MWRDSAPSATTQLKLDDTSVPLAACCSSDHGAPLAGVRACPNQAASQTCPRSIDASMPLVDRRARTTTVPRYREHSISIRRRRPASLRLKTDDDRERGGGRLWWAIGTVHRDGIEDFILGSNPRGWANTTTSVARCRDREHHAFTQPGHQSLRPSRRRLPRQIS